MSRVGRMDTCSPRTIKMANCKIEICSPSDLQMECPLSG